ncbi:MAG: hypothetical protein K0R08_1046 [Solimicrobium sp.]|nr:hypothetical protein [Solimicrobium sp.]
MQLGQIKAIFRGISYISYLEKSLPYKSEFLGDCAHNYVPRTSPLIRADLK